MISSKKLSRQQRTVRLVVLALVLVGLGMLLPRLVSLAGSIIMWPVHSVHVWLSESGGVVPTFFRDRESLTQEIAGLRSELDLAKQDDDVLVYLRQENEKLRSLLNGVSEPRTEAAVVGRPGVLPYDLLQIDQGSESGIMVGAPVFAGSDLVIGLVAYVADRYSFVKLVTAPEFRATAFVFGPNLVTTLEGVGGGAARVEIPPGVSLAIGDVVVLPGVEPGLFGRVAHVTQVPTQPQQYGYIVPDIAISSLYKVTVGAPAQVTHSVGEINARLQEEINRSLLVEGVAVLSASSSAISTNEHATTTVGL